MKNILILQGANLRTIGLREKSIYGETNALDLEHRIHCSAKKCGFKSTLIHANGQGEMIDILENFRNESISGVIINPGGLMHDAFALRDCLSCYHVPVIEVHISNTSKRGLSSKLSSGVTGIISGFGLDSYLIALNGMKGILELNKDL